MKNKFLILLLILTSLLGYLEWGKDKSTFLFQAEAEILFKLFKEPSSVIHPFTLLPLTGQLILLITLFQKKPGKILTFTGIVAISILLIFMFIIGILSLKLKILISSLPFLFLAYLTIRKYRKTG